MLANSLCYTAHAWERCAQLTGLAVQAAQTLWSSPTEEPKGRREIYLAHIYFQISEWDRKKAAGNLSYSRLDSQSLCSPQSTGNKRLTKLSCCA